MAAFGVHCLRPAFGVASMRVETSIKTVRIAEVFAVNRVLLVVAIAMTVALSLSARAEESKRTWVVGILSNASSMDEPMLSNFRKRLHELGYGEGQNLKIEFRTAQNQASQVSKLAEQLVELKVDAIFVTSTSAAVVMKRATSDIPIVMVGDPVGLGFALDLAHPGGNLTGFSIVSTELTRKRLQLLKETIPRLVRVSVLWNPDMPWHTGALKDLKAVSPELSIELKFVSVRSTGEFETAIATVKRARAQALYVLESPLVFLHRTELVNAAVAAGLPVTHAVKEYAKSGPLMTYGPNYSEIYRRSADYVDKILRGTKPQDLPIEQPTKFELILNLKTARRLGIKIPESILVRADEVIR